MATRLFAHGIHEQSKSMMILKRIIVPLLAVHVVLALWSGYRAIVQVYSVDVWITNPVLRVGSPVAYTAVGSGRVTVTVQLELIQNSLKQQIGRRVINTYTTPSYDPRPIRGSEIVSLTPEMLAPFAAGPATIRATATGRAQWLRTPPPTVREIAVAIEK
jgi:hypothetical protein